MSSRRVFSTARIHPSSIIDLTALTSEDVEIGPFCIIGPGVKIGARKKLLSSINIVGSIWIGKECEIFLNVVLGAPPQVCGFKSQQQTDTEKPLGVIGDKCISQEFVSVHQSTAGPINQHGWGMASLSCLPFTLHITVLLDIL